MLYILLILIFVSPPNKDPKEKRIWTLQSTTTLEMATYEWCKSVAEGMNESINTANTLTARTYCIPKDQKDLKVSEGMDKMLQQFSAPSSDREAREARDKLIRSFQIPAPRR